MKVKVGDLRKQLKTTGYSAEDLSKEVSISNMTIRRILKRADDDDIPQKYQLQFSQILAPKIEWEPIFPNMGDEKEILANLIREGSDAQAGKTVQKDLAHKLKDPRIAGKFLQDIQLLARLAFSKKISKTARAVCIGAILYLINPVDLIPDAMVPFGYLDDIAVVSLAVGYLLKSKSIKSEVV